MSLQLGLMAWSLLSVPVSLVIAAALGKASEHDVEVVYRDEHVIVLTDGHGLHCEKVHAAI